MIVALWELLFTFFRIGLIGFGGGYAMISMIFTESAKLGITLEQFADLTALDLVVPGPIAINASTYVGYLNSGVAGAIVATVGVCIPSFLIVLIVMHTMEKFKKNTWLQGFLSGVKPSAVGLIAAAAVTIAAGVLVNEGTSFSLSPVAAAIFVVVCVASIKFKIDPILLTVLSGVVGAFFLT